MSELTANDVRRREDCVPEFEGDLDQAPLGASEAVSLVGEIEPAGEIAREADEVIARLGQV